MGTQKHVGSHARVLWVLLAIGGPNSKKTVVFRNVVCLLIDAHAQPGFAVAPHVCFAYQSSPLVLCFVVSFVFVWLLSVSAAAVVMAAAAVRIVCW